MMRKWIAAALVLVAMWTVFLSFPVTVSADSLYIRKIVSVVYDDSGSMYGDKWAYANYAMQAFCGMLNSEDRLYVTYMSHAQPGEDYDPEQIDLSADGIQDSINAIQRHAESGYTPYTAVEIAYNKLKSIDDSNVHTQYWLVVITDGVFNETGSMNDDSKKRFLNEHFKDYAESVMPNGTHPQVTFLGIGGVVPPDANHSEGIYTYSAQNADDIMRAMSEMADRISGRTRLGKTDVRKIDDQTIQVSSSIPLLNMAVLSQGSNAQITKAVYSNETTIPVSRDAKLSYPSYSDLVGGAVLLGDSKSVIGSGTYNISFDQKVDLDDVVILFEPALETRMRMMVNGKEITDYRELGNLMEGDRISASCKIYEMGTDTEINPSLLPPGTKFEVTVTENGKVVKSNSGKDMLLSEYVLKNVKTEITAAVMIEGFNPIDYSEKFTPAKYVPRIKYTIDPSFGGDVTTAKIDEITNNKDLSVCFTVYADGVAMTNTNSVKALNPMITTTPPGNNGTTTYTDDGRIVFTPNSASAAHDDADSFDVVVTCTIEDGTKASKTYTVLTADYQAVPVANHVRIRKNEFYGNDVGVSFYITKDGVKLDKDAIEKHVAVVLNEEHKGLKFNIELTPDGTITVTPYSEERRERNFRNWWGNWIYYFGLDGKDIHVTVNHSSCSASGKIDVVQADAKYLILHVYLPLFTEILLLAAIVAYIVRYCTKAKFAKGVVLYVGTLELRNKKEDYSWGQHRISDLNEWELTKYNKFRYLWNPFRDLIVNVGVEIKATKSGSIQCNAKEPWYTAGSGTVLDQLEALYKERKKVVDIPELRPGHGVTADSIGSGRKWRKLPKKTPQKSYYLVNAKVEEKTDRILSAQILCYTTKK